MVLKNEKVWLSVEEAAAYTTLSTQTIYNWISQGRIPYHKVGSRTLLLRSDLDDLICSTRRESDF